MSTNMTGGFIDYAKIGTNPDAPEKRTIASVGESEQTEKTLHHLNGRVEELRARLERVLSPQQATGSPLLTANGDAKAAVSPLTDRLRSFRRLAQNSIDVIEDILNRLDV